jgi:hypothetical protein
MSSESKKQNPKPAAVEHRAVTRLKAVEEASKKAQVESESAAPDVAEDSQQQHTQGLTFKTADAFFPADGEKKEPSEGDGESSESAEEASVQDDESQAAEEISSKMKVLHNQLSFLAHLKRIPVLLVHLKFWYSGFISRF